MDRASTVAHAQVDQVEVVPAEAAQILFDQTAQLGGGMEVTVPRHGAAPLRIVVIRGSSRRGR
jgi:hypothetical protein